MVLYCVFYEDVHINYCFEQPYSHKDNMKTVFLPCAFLNVFSSPTYLELDKNSKYKIIYYLSEESLVDYAIAHLKLLTNTDSPSLPIKKRKTNLSLLQIFYKS